MKDRKIREKYATLLGVFDRKERLKQLDSLHREAVKQSFPIWVRLIKAHKAYLNEQYEESIKHSSNVIKRSESDPKQKAWALINRGLAFGEQGETDKAIADFTAVIDDPATSSEQTVKARVNRGVTFGQKGETDKAISDLTPVIDDPAAPAEQRAMALVNRGIAFEQKGEIDKAISDFTAVVDDLTAPAEQRVVARISRATSHIRKGNLDKCKNDVEFLLREPTLPTRMREYVGFLESIIEETGSPEAVRATETISVEIDEATKQKFRNALIEGSKRKNYFFQTESRFKKNASLLLVLREWNSYTPAIPDEKEPARGGGYFLRHQGIGIVIDPGIDFLEIFWEAGGRLCDIDYIVITHAHNDHTADLEAILTLLYEFNDKNPITPHKITLLLSQGSARKFSGMIALKDCPYIREVVTLNRGRKINPQVIILSPNIFLTVLPAYHDDVITRDYSVGIGLDLTINETNRRVLFTSDTAFMSQNPDENLEPIHKVYPKPYSSAGEIDLLVAHIGTIDPDELKGTLARFSKESKLPQLEEKYYPKHLGLRGTFILAYLLQPRAMIISEFGEEMKSIWIEAVRAIGRKLSELCKYSKRESIPIFAGDPFLICDLQNLRFLCHEDLRFHPANELEMIGCAQASGKGIFGPTRPYLFFKSTGFKDDSERTSCIRKFHSALEKRTLPYFI